MQKFSILSFKRKNTLKGRFSKKDGLENRCISIRAIGLGVVAKGKEKREKLIQEGERAVQEDRAEVLILGCIRMAGLDKEIGKIFGVLVIDGVAVAVM